MRTIKFRAKSCNTGEWVYGNLYVADSLSTYIHKSMDSFLEVCSETIGQFTGLYACGKEIYEGDILKWKADTDNLLYAVIFNWGMFYASIEVCNQEIYGGFPLHALAEENGKDVEIVGNIYDNPELKKKYKEIIEIKNPNNNE